MSVCVVQYALRCVYFPVFCLLPVTSATRLTHLILHHLCENKAAVIVVVM